MKLFECECCAQPLFFENVACEKCGHRLGYDPQERQMRALEQTGYGLWRATGDWGREWRFCTNADHGVCNWLLPAPETGLCLSCRHNRTIPDLGDPSQLTLWRRMEDAKHRLTYTLLALRLPLDGLTFDVLGSAPGGPSVMTGHSEGLVTLNIAEADDSERERRRHDMGETYRTLLGHVRHEVGHFYWDSLVRQGGKLDAFRALFGDERQDYAQALQRHYAQGARGDWQLHHVSAYASAHPWEDFAETFAHCLHIVDTLETAQAFGLSVRQNVTAADDLSTDIDFDPHRETNEKLLIEAWLPLCFAVNSLNRSMGQPDLYPFVLSPEAIGKLGFVAALTHDR